MRCATTDDSGLTDEMRSTCNILEEGGEGENGGGVRFILMAARVIFSL